MAQQVRPQNRREFMDKMIVPKDPQYGNPNIIFSEPFKPGQPEFNRAYETKVDDTPTKKFSIGIKDIDEAMKLGTNQPMGPLTLADFIGLDTCLYIMGVLHEGLGDSKYRPAPLLRQYVEAGWLGRKSGRGFYAY
jgi:hypothetical protein